MATKLPIVGQIVHEYRISNDISASAFAAACGRTRKWTYNLEQSGRGFERTWAQIGKAFPDLKQAIIRAIGRFPPQQFAEVDKLIQAGRAKV